MTHETGPDGVLTEHGALAAFVAGYGEYQASSGVPEGTLNGQNAWMAELGGYRNIAQAQHQADVEAVKAIENPIIMRDTLEVYRSKGFESGKQAALEVLGERKCKGQVVKP